MDKKTFIYQYSAEKNKEIEHIRSKYLPKETDKLARIRHLDLQVKTAGQWQALCLGTVGVLLFGIGMCFGLGVFGGATWLAYPFGIIGALVMAPAYPLCRYIAGKTRAALAPEILRLSEELLGKSGEETKEKNKD